ncbi:MucB/RseB C-terminal domain-containing protein [Nitrincola nitratireducens]|uniref:Sigma-E factor negative regulatory protein n=1 Tax=Nitrincola nitratireducens TaxID=1229521 RepID=W9UWV8_9GAMM|nr:MucB/RseB C-terminal domain-containing protein [Nitrincola nitratireducens]EXJ11564.1 Sigma-E factor negative regulatory protein [Nitrincola nitratireducens]
MNEQVEPLSALVDGEVSELELRRILKQIEGNSLEVDKWRRYHLISSLMKNESHSVYTTDLSSAVMSAINESDVKQQRDESVDIINGHQSNFWKSLASMAVAASVTAVIILGAGWQSPSNDAVVTLPSIAANPSTASSYAQQARFGGISSTQLDHSSEIIRSKDTLQRYVDQHQFYISDQRYPQWSIGWLPDGFRNIRHESVQHGEVMVFSNGRQAFSVTIEDRGRQALQEGVSNVGDYIAVGKIQGDKFVTVVGNMPIMIAERIASSVDVSR